MTPVGLKPTDRDTGVFREEMTMAAGAAGTRQHLAVGLHPSSVLIVLMPDIIEMTRRQIQ
jgi:hypothetical protein